MQYSRATLKIMGIVKLSAGLLLALISSRRFFLHHYDFRLIRYSALLLPITLVTAGTKRLYRMGTMPF